MSGGKKAAVLLLVALWLLLPGSRALAAEEDDLYEKSGAQSLYDSLDGDTKEMLSWAGVEGAMVGGDLELTGLWQGLSQWTREQLGEPFRALAGVVAVAVLCRLAGCFEGKHLGETAPLVGSLACAVLLLEPLLGLLRQVEALAQSASAFLAASVPVYAGLLLAGGASVTGASYSFLPLAAGNGIPLLVNGFVLPLLRVFLALSLACSVSSAKLGKLPSSLYGAAKWTLAASVTLYSGLLSIQTALNAQVDAASGKTVKLLASSAIPIVGGALGDAVGAIQSSLLLVKSGVGAFGILAALCLFAPAMIQAGMWIAVCTLGQIAGDLLEVPKLSGLLGALGSAAKMALAVLCSIFCVTLVTAAVVLFVKGSL